MILYRSPSKVILGSKEAAYIDQRCQKTVGIKEQPSKLYLSPLNIKALDKHGQTNDPIIIQRPLALNDVSMLGLTLGRCFSRNAIQSKHYMYDARPIALSSLSYRRHFSESLIPETWRNGIQRRLFSSTHVPYVDKNSLPTPPKLHSLENSEDTKTAREWVERWKALRPEDDIPRSVVEVTFAKSTGPGGQNVNKVATKASMRLSLGSKWWIPQWSLPFIQADTHYVASSNSLLITSHRTRSQAENLDDCFRKLHNIILTAASKPIKNEPSESQKKRVELLERADKARRRQSKSYRSGVKKYRGSKGVSID